MQVPLFWLTIRRSLLRCGPLGPCCLRLRLQLHGRAGGTQNFFSKLCFQSCSWTLSSRTLSVCQRRPRQSAHGRTGRKVGHQNFSPARGRSAATCQGRPALELDARGNFSTSTESISVPTSSRRFSENLFHDFFHRLWYGKVTMVWESLQSACAAESAPESTNTIPQFVLESQELKQQQIKKRCALKCALVGSTGSPLKYHLTLGMGTSTFCTVDRFCTRSCNFALHRPLGFEPNTPATETVRCCNRSELRPHLPKSRLVEQGTEDPEHRHPTRK